MAYTKYHSNYIKRQIHKRLGGDSVIVERDWVTTRGARQRLGLGQSAIYGNGNFVFSTSNIPNSQRRHVGSADVSIWKYDDVTNATGNQPASDKQIKSNDLRDYAYYGSCVELIRSSLENIIYEFPGRIRGTTNDILIKDEKGNDDESYYIVDNPFGIDLFHVDSAEIELSPYDNELRFLCLAWDKYGVTAHTVTPVTDCHPNDGYWHKHVTINISTVTPVPQNVEIIMCVRGRDVCYVSKNTTFEIAPKPEVIENYFQSLRGFEAVLLNRDSKPLYSNILITPVMGQLTYQYVKRRYTWPSDDGYIQIDTPSYYMFVDKLLEMAQAFDETCCDNLYGRMTHESIKRYDTTFDREYTEGDAEDNIEGGARMEKVVRLMGRVFDDIKLSADGIGRTIQIGYNSPSTDPDVVDSKLELAGFEVSTIIPQFIKDDGSIESVADVTPLVVDKTIEWYPTEKYDNITMTMVDEEFRKRLLLSASYINSCKGTVHGVEMILGLFGLKMGKDYDIQEYYRVLENPTDFPYDIHYDRIYEVFPYCSFDDDFKEFPSIPLKGVRIGKENYIIPYFESDKVYADPFFAFQSNGGWAKGLDNSKPNEYLETMNYLPVVSEFDDLLNLDSGTVKNGDMYYVAKLDSYVTATNVIDESVLAKLGHIFKCVDEHNPWLASSWQNEGGFDDDQDIQRAEYLKRLVNNNTGNNPHIGYGNYDDGDSFYRTMKQPFLYAMEHSLVGKPLETASQYQFSFVEISCNSKIDNDLKIWNNVNIHSNEVANHPSTLYNDKRFVLHFNKILAENKYFQTYFRTAIMPYLTQVIPSTTIFQIKWQNN